MRTDNAIAEGARARLIACGVDEALVHIDYGEPTQDDDLPFIDLFVVASEDAPDGDPRTDVTKYTCDTMLVVSILARGNTARAVKAWLATTGEQVLDALFSDRDWATLDGQPFIEGYGAIRRIYELPPKGNHITGRLQLQIRVLYRSRFGATPSTLPDLSAFAAGVDFTGDGTADLTVEFPLPTT